jgi:hypothetical protein
VQRWAECELNHLIPSSAELKKIVEFYLHVPCVPSWSGALWLFTHLYLLLRSEMHGA